MREDEGGARRGGGGGKMHQAEAESGALPPNAKGPLAPLGRPRLFLPLDAPNGRVAARPVFPFARGGRSCITRSASWPSFPPGEASF